MRGKQTIVNKMLNDNLHAIVMFKAVQTRLQGSCFNSYPFLVEGNDFSN
ncbi:hypothetical protein XIS1_920004 [Xenorhabdus innexi]|uniref:Uncharacterized protein n=1 Tax=Xenorhabdus innexi TaxID=290109 RepID=A0A1N6N224_9GAMM|nr:hypothetical protein XIS1_920004 [Xenorhabdus innexi]